MLEATANFLNCRQGQQQTVSNYMETLKSHVDTIKYHGGTGSLKQNLAPDRAPDGRPLSGVERMRLHPCGCTQYEEPIKLGTVRC